MLNLMNTLVLDASISEASQTSPAVTRITIASNFYVHSFLLLTVQILYNPNDFLLLCFLFSSISISYPVRFLKLNIKMFIFIVSNHRMFFVLFFFS